MPRCDAAPTAIDGLVLLQRYRMDDARGFLSRVYAADEFGAAGLTKPIVHINHTLTRHRGTVRGLHFQTPPHAEMKVVSCLRGEVYDVAVDLRRNSPTFLAWHAEVLSLENQRSLLIPEGFAHGFQALTDDCQLLYLHTAAYVAAAESGLNAVDPRLAIRWPLDIADMSERDRGHAMLTSAFEGIAG
jgi:dTDP-4-dehydrorhamnose 3,5-epimerase